MRRFYVDASVFISLAEIGEAGLITLLDGEIVIPKAVTDEISDEPAIGVLRDFERSGRIVFPGIDEVPQTSEVADRDIQRAAKHLGREQLENPGGDLILLAYGISDGEGVILTDDKPLRNACKALNVPISGSLGVIISSVESGELYPSEAKNLLVAMDEVGARLSARLLRKAERMIEEAGEKREG